jgi:hypothetical protein
MSIIIPLCLALVSFCALLAVVSLLECVLGKGD